MCKYFSKQCFLASLFQWLLKAEFCNKIHFFHHFEPFENHLFALPKKIFIKKSYIFI